MTGAFARILLRYLAGALVAKGLLATDMGTTLASDPDILSMVELGLGALVGLATEGYYVLAKRWGWPT